MRVNGQQSAISSQHLLVKLFVLIFTIHFSLFTFNSFSQNVGISINTSGAPPNNAAILDVSSTSLGVLVPRMTALERNAISSPVPESLLIYNTDRHCFEAYYNGGWVAFGCLSSCQVPAQPTPGTNTSSETSIVWNWSTVNGSSSYKWATIATYSFATDNGTNTTYTQTGLTCNTPYTLYVWAYNSCGNSSYAALTQTTSACSCTISCGTQIWACTNLNAGTQISQTMLMTSPWNEKWCANDLPANCNSYGGLYYWKDMMMGAAAQSCDTCGPTTGHGGAQGMCPYGWHIPSTIEWARYAYCVDVAIAPVDVNPATNTWSYWSGCLTNGSMCGANASPLNTASKLKAKSSDNPPSDGTNNSGFGAINGGGIASCGGCSNWPSAGTNSFNSQGYYWTAEGDNGNANDILLQPGSNSWDLSVWFSYDMLEDQYQYGNSVRCLKD